MYAAEDSHLLADRVRSQQQLRHIEGERDMVFLAMPACFLAAALVLALLLRQIVGRPPDRLRDDALRAAGGDFEGRIVTPTGPAELPSTTGDPTLLTMVWQNLVGNAVKFRSADRPPVITVRSGTGPDGWYAFTVTDNGVGIPAEFNEKVFVVFRRLHSRDGYEGTGSGLAMCRKIIEHHGGRIMVDTSYTGGTGIRFTLPGPAPADPAPSTEGAQPE
ncbi:sensor histidine kinase [Actinacidiphila sp. ITFR-21]|uniref:sensor histidine kinase n=1 Tax=Actinacidiphila sp. ITFR-21 TaxID=3075199 RepID=UPI00288B4820|nr:ATP-binding protein [Streptomyces sp. ITFR-21]WNI14990.1 ATP-binding protein [Streptomyces sp. ITFR-21]